MRTIIVYAMQPIPKADSKMEKAFGGAGDVPQRVSSEALLGSRRELVIVHNAREYRLRLTQSGKLILTA
jgi:hemin uptake protein HemP